MKHCIYCGRFVPGDSILSQINDDEQGYTCKRCHEKARTTLHYKRWHRFEVDDIKYPGEGITLLERVANIIGVQTRKYELAALKLLKGMVGDA